MTKPTPKSKPTGRPAGSETKSRPLQEIAIAIEPCRHCGESVQPVDKRNRRDIEGDGTFAGRPYSGATFWSANCGNCGGALSIVQRNYTD